MKDILLPNQIADTLCTISRSYPKLREHQNMKTSKIRIIERNYSCLPIITVFSFFIFFGHCLFAMPSLFLLKR